MRDSCSSDHEPEVGGCGCSEIVCLPLVWVLRGAGHWEGGERDGGVERGGEALQCLHFIPMTTCHF